MGRTFVCLLSSDWPSCWSDPLVVPPPEVAKSSQPCLNILPMAANNYYGIPVHGQPAQYTAAATAYPAAPAVGYTAVGNATAATAATSYAQRVPNAAQAAPVAA